VPDRRPELLDRLEFGERIRNVDVIDDATFLTMDLEFLGRPELGDFFLRQYRALSEDPNEHPESLQEF
jgi:aminoglycoside phosphotransferase family enzyme